MMSRHNFTVQDVVREVRKLAQERPHFNYRDQLHADSAGCSYLGASMYTPGEGEGCIMGQALQRLGVSREELLLHEGRSASQAIGDLTLLGSDVNYWVNVARWLDHVQTKQDTGFTWQEAVAGGDWYTPIEDRKE